MNAPCAKIDHCAPTGSLHHALSFGRQQRLDMDLVHQVRLDELASWQRGNHLKDRLIGKKRGAFRESVNLACEAEMAQ